MVKKHPRHFNPQSLAQRRPSPKATVALTLGEDLRQSTFPKVTFERSYFLLITYPDPDLESLYYHITVSGFSRYLDWRIPLSYANANMVIFRRSCFTLTSYHTINPVSSYTHDLDWPIVLSDTKNTICCKLDRCLFGLELVKAV